MADPNQDDLYRSLHFPAHVVLLLLQGLNFRAMPARSLEWDRPVEQPRPEVEHSKFRQLLLSISGFYSKESQLLRGRSWSKACCSWRTPVLNKFSASNTCYSIE